MPNIIAAVVVLGLLVFGVRFAVSRRNTPARRLERDFKRLKKSILGSIESKNSPEAEKLLDACEKHLSALVTAREQHLMLTDMRASASELTGQAVESGSLVAFDQSVAEKLSEFFGTLTRISTVVSLGTDETMSQLRGFASDLEIQRDTLNELFND